MHEGPRRYAAPLALLFLATALAAPEAQAQQKVDVQTEVVLASNDGTTIEPPHLSKMKEEFARSGITFTSWKRQSQQKVSLEQGGTRDVSLPDGRKASLSLVNIKEGSASVRVTVPDPQDRKRKLVETVYQLGRQGSVFIPCGDYKSGKLILVLSPPGK